MYKIYEIRNKATHRVEFLNLFNATQEKPDDGTFNAVPPETNEVSAVPPHHLFTNETSPALIQPNPTWFTPFDE